MGVISKYRIEYPDNGFIQYKNLISHSEYLEVIVPIIAEITDIEQKYTKGKADKLIWPLKKRLKPYGTYFTDRSPLFDAIETGILDMGKFGRFPAILTKIE